MKTLKKIKNLIEEKKDLLEKEYHVKRLGIFGSYAKQKAKKDSDIDIFVEFSETPDFFKFIALEERLAEILGSKVDLVTPKALKPFIKNTILRETIYI